MKTLDELSKEYVGKEVFVTESNSTMNIAGQDHSFTNFKLNPESEALIDALEKELSTGYILRVWLPDTIGTMECRTNRLNVTIEKDDKGKFKIQNLSFG